MFHGVGFGVVGFMVSLGLSIFALGFCFCWGGVPGFRAYGF